MPAGKFPFSDPPIRLVVRIPKSVLEEVEAKLKSKNGKMPYGARSSLVAKLLREWIRKLPTEETLLLRHLDKIKEKAKMQPSEKSPAMEEFLEKNLGFSRTTAITTDTCAICNQPAMGFKDELSVREYKISGLCQKCQDEVFGE